MEYTDFQAGTRFYWKGHLCGCVDLADSNGEDGDVFGMILEGVPEDKVAAFLEAAGSLHCSDTDLFLENRELAICTPYGEVVDRAEPPFPLRAVSHESAALRSRMDIAVPAYIQPC